MIHSLDNFIFKNLKNMSIDLLNMEYFIIMKNFIFPQIFQPVLIKNGCNLSFSQKYMTSRSRQPETDLPNQLNNK